MEQCVKRGDAEAPKAIARWKDTLAKLGRAGVPVVCYNFMPVVDWTRTDLRWRAPRGQGLALRFEMVDFVAYDVFILKRPNAADNYAADLVARAETRVKALSEDEKLLLERNIIAGLPGGALTQTRESITALLASFDGIDAAATMQGNLIAFLKEVVRSRRNMASCSASTRMIRRSRSSACRASSRRPPTCARSSLRSTARRTASPSAPAPMARGPTMTSSPWRKSSAPASISPICAM